MQTTVNKMICFYYAVKFQFAFLIKKFRMRKFIKENPDFALMFSSEADKRLRNYIENTDVRLKRLAASVMLENYMDSLMVTTNEQLSKVELNYLTNLIPEIKKDLKII